MTHGEASGHEETKTETRARRTALIVPVGNVTDPPVVAFRSLTPPPDCVAFVVSPKSEGSLETIRKKILPATPLVRIIRIKDPQDLSLSLKTISRALPGILDEWQVAWKDMTVDITGGTKVMVAALALATIWSCKSYLYVGGTKRDEATGRVVPGSELPLRAVNPWEQLGMHHRRRIAWAFNRLDFSLAEEGIDQALKTCADSERPHLEALAKLVKGCTRWDQFYYEQAAKKLREARIGLAPRWDGQPRGRRSLASLDAAISRLEVLLASLRKEAPSRPFLLDLLANAERSGKRKRFDDAVARLYRFVEGAAQQALFDEYGIVTSSVPAEKLPDTDDWKADREAGAPVELPLKKAYQLLADKGHKLGQFYEEIKPPEGKKRKRDKGKLASYLRARNMSPLAHGMKPVSPHAWEGLFDACIQMAEVEQEDLFRFPTLPEADETPSDGSSHEPSH